MKAGTLELELIANVAKLQDDMQRVEKAVGKMADGVERKTRAANDNFGKMGKSGQLAGHHMQNLAFQLQDVAVSLQAGQRPMTVFMQQGSQIAGIAMQAGVGFGGMAKAIAGVTGRFLAAHPVLLGFGAAAGTAALGLSILTDQVNAEHKAELDAYAASLGLTAEEIEKAGGAAVTSGDMISGLWEIIKEALGLKGIFDDLKGWIVDTFMSAAQDAKKNVSEIYAAVTGTVDGIKAVWDKIPAIIGEALVNGANRGIGAFEQLINSYVEGLNVLVRAANSIGGVFGASKIGEFGPVKLGRLTNQYAGAGAAAADAFSGAYQRRLQEAEGAFDSFFARWGEAGVAARNKRLLSAVEKDAEKGGKDAGKAFSDKFAQEVERLLGSIAKDMGKALVELRKAGLKAFDERTGKEIDAIVESVGRLDNAAVNAAEAQGAWNAQIEQTLGLLGQLGSTGGALSALMLAMRGDFGGAGLSLGGAGGALLQMLGGVQWVEHDQDGRIIKKLGEEFHNVLTGIFGKSFESTLSSVFNGAGMGTAASQIVYGGKANLGGTIGGAIAGGFSESFGKSVGKMLGSEALGSIGGALLPVVGGIVGNLIGGLFTSTKRGGATFGGSGSSLGVAGTWGNSSSRVSGATGLAGGVVDSLERIADALGASVGSFTGSISIREKNLRYDPTGSGISKTSKGALNFGQDEAALIRAVLEDAISDGVFEGLSAGVERILKGEGDLDAKLSKALSFKGVFEELSQAKDPQAYELEQLSKWRAEMDGIFADAGASAEEIAQLEELTAIKRKAIVERFADDASDIERQRAEMQVELLAALGKAEEAEALARQLQLESMAEGLRAKQEEIWAALDAAEAEKRLTEEREAARAKAEEIARQKQSLELEIMELEGNAIGATAIRRREEKEAADESLWPLIERRNALLDEAEATREAAAAKAEADRVAAAIASERYGLETRLLQLQGNAAELERRQLAELDESNRSLLSQILATEKAIAAEEALKQAREEAAAKAEQIARDRLALELEIMELEGNADKAKSIRRQMEIDAADESLRGLMARRNALQDAAEAARAAEEAQRAANEAAQAAAAERERQLEAARATLIDAYQSQRGELEATANTFRSFAQSVAEFRRGLFLDAASPAGSLGMLRSRYKSTVVSALNGNQDAYGRIANDGSAYLSAARDRAGSLAEYQDALIETAALARSAEANAATRANLAERELWQVTQAVSELVDLNEKTVSVNEAIDALTALQAEEVVPAVVESFSLGLAQVTSELQDNREEAAKAEANGQKALEAVRDALKVIEGVLTRADRGDFLAIGADADSPLAVNSTVVNTTDNPVPTQEVA